MQTFVQIHATVELRSQKQEQRRTKGIKQESVEPDYRSHPRFLKESYNTLAQPKPQAAGKIARNIHRKTLPSSFNHKRCFAKLSLISIRFDLHTSEQC